MANYTTIPLKSTMTAGYFGDDLKTANADFYKPNWHKRVLDEYPQERSLLLNATRLAGNVTSFPSDHIKVQYRGAIQRAITTGILVATTTPKQPVTITLDASDYDATLGTSYLRDNFNVYIPSMYVLDGATSAVSTATAPLPFRVESHTGTGASTQWKLVPVGNYGICATGLPAGTTCLVGDSSFGLGDGAPDGMVDYNYIETFYPQIAKEALRWDGSVMELMQWEDEFENGQDTFLRGTELSHLRLDAQLEMAGWMGVTNDNTLLISKNHPSARSDSNVFTTKGIIPQLDDDGMQLPYNESMNIIDVLRYVKTMQETQMVTETKTKAFAGPNYMGKFEDDELNVLKAFSYTDLNKKIEQLGYAIHIVYSNGRYIEFYEMPSWGKPNSYGAPGMPFPDLSVFIPYGQATAKIGEDSVNELTLSNLTLSFFKSKGIDRTRVARLIDGTTGHSDIAANEYDEGSFILLTHFAWMLFHKNQMIVSKKVSV